MKIAILGKGGSGKSTVSWILANYFLNTRKVLAIDEDFNMDLIDQFGYQPSDFESVANNHNLFKQAFDMEPTQKWFDLVQRTIPDFDLNSNIVSQLSKKVHPNLSLMLTGLGDEENLYTGKCGHSHSAPLKFLLPKITTSDDEIILIDSVAGVDMLSYGLFMGCDMIISVVEPAKNSIKIATQIKEFCMKLNLPSGFVINKYFENDLIKNFIDDNAKSVLGKIPLNSKIGLYDYNQIQDDIENDLKEISQNLDSKNFEKVDQWQRLIDFENQKDSIKQYFSKK